MKVLVVEDDPPLAEIIRRNLNAHGHEPSVAVSVRSAVRQVRAAQPEVLVLDVNLPDGSGWDVLRQIDAPCRTHLRVVVISAAPVSQKRVEEFRPECVLQKPFSMTSLLRSLENDEQTRRLSPEGLGREGIDLS